MIERSPPPGPEVTDVLDSGAAGGAAIRGSAMRASGYTAAMLLSLASLPLVTRHLGVAGFGQYVLVLSVVAIVSGLTEAGLTSIGIREYAVRKGADRAAVMRNLLGFRIALTLVGVAAATGFAALVGYDDALVLGTLVAGIGLLVQVVQIFYSIPLQASLRLGWVTVVEIVRQGTTVALLILLVLAGAGLVPLLAAGIPAGLIALALTLWLARGTVPVLPALDPGRLLPLMRDSAAYAAATAINVLYFRVTIVLMSLIAVELETGYFATSYRVVEVLLSVPALLVAATFPVVARAARDDPERFRYVARRIFEVTVILGVGAGLALALGAGVAIQVVAGEQAEPSVSVLRIQALALIPAFVTMGAGFPLLALRRHMELLVPNVLALAAAATLTLVLVPPYGARGAAVATVAAETVLAVALVVLLARARRDLRLPLGILPAVAVAAGLAALVVLVPQLPELARVAIAVLVYFGVLRAAGRIPPEIGAALRGRDAFARVQP